MEKSIPIWSLGQRCCWWAGQQGELHGAQSTGEGHVTQPGKEGNPGLHRGASGEQPFREDVKLRNEEIIFSHPNQALTQSHSRGPRLYIIWPME